MQLETVGASCPPLRRLRAQLARDRVPTDRLARPRGADELSRQLVRPQREQPEQELEARSVQVPFSLELPPLRGFIPPAVPHQREPALEEPDVVFPSIEEPRQRDPLDLTIPR